MKTTRHWTSIWDADTQPGQFSYQGGSVMWSSRQYEWGNGLEINESADGYVRALKQEGYGWMMLDFSRWGCEGFSRGIPAVSPKTLDDLWKILNE